MKTIIILMALAYIPFAEIVEPTRAPKPKFIQVFNKRKGGR